MMFPGITRSTMKMTTEMTTSVGMVINSLRSMYLLMLPLNQEPAIFASRFPKSLDDKASIMFC